MKASEIQVGGEYAVSRYTSSAASAREKYRLVRGRVDARLASIGSFQVTLPDHHDEVRILKPAAFGATWQDYVAEGVERDRVNREQRKRRAELAAKRQADLDRLLEMLGLADTDVERPYGHQSDTIELELPVLLGAVDALYSRVLKGKGQ